MDIRKFAADIFSDQRCYLCGWPQSLMTSHCGLLDCPRKIAAPQMPVSARTGDAPTADGTSGWSLASSAVAAPCPTCKVIPVKEMT